MCTQACRRMYNQADVDGVTAGSSTTGGSAAGSAAGYYFSTCDVQLLRRVPELAAAGINTLAIEGRTKNAGYTGTVVSAYRLVIDAAASGDEEKLRQSVLLGEKILRGDYRRPKTEYFFSGAPSAGWLNPVEDGVAADKNHLQSAAKRYRSVIAHNSAGGHAPGRDKAPDPVYNSNETAVRHTTAKNSSAPKNSDAAKRGKKPKDTGFPKGCMLPFPALMTFLFCSQCGLSGLCSALPVLPAPALPRKSRSGRHPGSLNSHCLSKQPILFLCCRPSSAM